MDYDYTRNKLQALFDQTGLTQKDFAQLCDLTQSTVTRLLSGKRSPQLVTLVKICQAFKVRPSFFVRELQEDELQSVPTLEDPFVPVPPLVKTLMGAVEDLDDDQLAEVIEYARYRRRVERRKSG